MNGTFEWFYVRVLLISLVILMMARDASADSLLPDEQQNFMLPGFSETDRIAYQQRWCEATFSDYSRGLAERERLGDYRITSDRVDQYAVNEILMEKWHRQLAEYCFYPSEL